MRKCNHIFQSFLDTTVKKVCVMNCYKHSNQKVHLLSYCHENSWKCSRPQNHTHNMECFNFCLTVRLTFARIMRAKRKIDVLDSESPTIMWSTSLCSCKQDYDYNNQPSCFIQSIIIWFMHLDLFVRTF